jgi:hypothetical protein
MGTLAVNIALYKSLPYDSLKDRRQGQPGAAGGARRSDYGQASD